MRVRVSECVRACVRSFVCVRACVRARLVEGALEEVAEENEAGDEGEDGEEREHAVVPVQHLRNQRSN